MIGCAFRLGRITDIAHAVLCQSNRGVCVKVSCRCNFRRSEMTMSKIKDGTQMCCTISVGAILVQMLGSMLVWLTPSKEGHGSISS